MIISLFRTSHPVSYVLLPLIGILLRVPLLFSSLDQGAEVFYSDVELMIVSKPWLNMLVSGFLAGVYGVLMNRISDEFGFLDRVSGLTGLAFVLITSWSPNSASFSLSYLVLPVFLLALFQLFSLGKSGGMSQVFNASILLSSGSLIIPETLVLSFLVPLAVVYFQTVHWRHFSIWILGVTLPYVYIAIWGVLFSNSSSVYIPDLTQLLSWQGVNSMQTISWLLHLLFIGGVLLLSLQSFSKGLTKNTTRIRKSYFLIIWAFLLTAYSFFQSSNFYTAPLVLIAIPLAFMLANYFFYSRKKALAEVALLIIVVIEVANYLL